MILCFNCDLPEKVFEAREIGIQTSKSTLIITETINGFKIQGLENHDLILKSTKDDNGIRHEIIQLPRGS
jgi:hypothetical protein